MGMGGACGSALQVALTDSTWMGLVLRQVGSVCAFWKAEMAVGLGPVTGVILIGSDLHAAPGLQLPASEDSSIAGSGLRKRAQAPESSIQRAVSLLQHAQRYAPALFAFCTSIKALPN
jgi:hypothetical protein